MVDGGSVFRVCVVKHTHAKKKFGVCRIGTGKTFMKFIHNLQHFQLLDRRSH